MRPNINIYRQQALLKGFVKVSHIMDFVPCNYKMAKSIMEEIKVDMSKDGKKFFEDRVPTKRLLPYIELTEKKINEYADIERKNEVC